MAHTLVEMRNILGKKPVHLKEPIDVGLQIDLSSLLFNLVENVLECLVCLLYRRLFQAFYRGCILAIAL